MKKSAFRNNLILARRNFALYVLLLPALVYIVLFHYLPIYGVQIAFRDFNFADGISGSPWVGWKWFQTFFRSNQSSKLIINTLTLSVYSLIAGFPMPILMAVIMHNLPSKKIRRISQTMTYLPHFISMVVLVGMINCFFSVKGGFVNTFITALGGHPIYFIGEPRYFSHLYVWSGIWQNTGWNSIIYLAALTSISQELHEAALIDGANKLQRIAHIDLPGILPTLVTLLILNCGSILSVGFEKVYLMQNDLNKSVSEILSTYTYKYGMLKLRYSYSSAIGLFNNAVNFVILLTVNAVSNRLTGTGLF